MFNANATCPTIIVNSIKPTVVRFILLIRIRKYSIKKLKALTIASNIGFPNWNLSRLGPFYH